MSNSDRAAPAVEMIPGKPPGSERRAPARRRKRRTQAQRTNEMRARLLKAAISTLRRHGYVGLRTEEVSRVAGVSRGAQLHHFPNKESLVIAATEQIFQASTDRGLARAASALSSKDPLEELIQDGHEFFFSEDFFVILDLVLMRGKNQASRDKIFEIARTHRPTVEAAWLDVLRRSGVPEKEAEKILHLTLTIVRGLAIRSLWQPDTKRFRALLDEWKAIVNERFSLRRNVRGKV